MILYVGGINGVGKTTVLKHLCSLNSKFKHLKGSTLLMEALNLPQGDYASLRKLSSNIKNKAFGDIIVSYASKYAESDFIYLIDAHFLNIVEGHTTKVLGDWLSKTDALILIEAPLKDIIKRIEKDSSFRDRSLITSDSTIELSSSLKKYSKETEDEMLIYAEKHNLPYKILNNLEGKLDLVAEQLIEFTKTL